MPQLSPKLNSCQPSSKSSARRLVASIPGVNVVCAHFLFLQARYAASVDVHVLIYVVSGKINAPAARRQNAILYGSPEMRHCHVKKLKRTPASEVEAFYTSLLDVRGNLGAVKDLSEDLLKARWRDDGHKREKAIAATGREIRAFLSEYLFISYLVIPTNVHNFQRNSSNPTIPSLSRPTASHGVTSPGYSLVLGRC